MNHYAVTYTDAHGSVETTLDNDGETLRMVLRGVTFSGADFDLLEPSPAATEHQLRTFVLSQQDLCSCRIQCAMPIKVTADGTTAPATPATPATLRMDLTLGAPDHRGGIDRQQLALALDHGGIATSGPGTSGWFEDELLAIQQQLPAGTFMQACINCAYSDYSPFGHGMFGSMMCFRNLKQEYAQVHSKDDFWDVHDRRDRFVQETYLCADFAIRTPGTGYRG